MNILDTTPPSPGSEHTVLPTATLERLEMGWEPSRVIPNACWWFRKHSLAKLLFIMFIAASGSRPVLRQLNLLQVYGEFIAGTRRILEGGESSGVVNAAEKASLSNSECFLASF